MKKKKTLVNATMAEDIVRSGRKCAFRADINEYCADYYEANLIRAILFEKGKYKRKTVELLGKEIDCIIDIDGKIAKENSVIVPCINQKFLDELLSSDIQEDIILLANVSLPNTICYESIDKVYREKIALWEDEKKNANKTPEFYKKQWAIGKREEKRVHKKFFYPSGKPIKIGQFWKKQPFKGRPKYEGMFLSVFRILSDEEVILEHENWGTIIMEVRRYLRDHPTEYFDTGKKLKIIGQVKKTEEWIDIASYDTMNCKYFIS